MLRFSCPSASWRISRWPIPTSPNRANGSTSIRIATCAVSGGFAHLYTALENNLFDKYGFKMEHVFIRGSGPSLAALMADEIQFLYCAADATLPSLAAGVDVKLVAAPLVKLPYVLVTRKEIRRLEDLKGKALGVARAGDLSDRLSRAVVKKFNVPDVTMRPIGGSQNERYQVDGRATWSREFVVTPPIDVRAKNDGFNVALSTDRSGHSFYLQFAARQLADDQGAAGNDSAYGRRLRRGDLFRR